MGRAGNVGVPVQRKILYSALVTVASLLGLEIGLRLAGIGTTTQSVPDALLGWKLLPNQTRRAGRDGNAGIVHINQHGMRDEDFPKEKPPGEFRILVLGDSSTYGVVVDQEETFCRRLHHLLNNGSGAQTFRVMNTGVPGYDLQQYRLYLEHRGLAFSPDVVLLVFNQNDILFNPEQRFYKPFYGRELLTRSAIFVFLDRLIRSKLLEALRDRDWGVGRIAPERRLIDMYKGQVPIDLTQPKEQVQFQLGCGILLEIREICRREGIRFAVALLPTFRQAMAQRHLNAIGRPLDRDAADALRDSLLVRMEAFLTENGIPVLNLLIPVSRTGTDGWLRDRGHFSPPGHSAIAEALFHFLRRKQLLPASASDGSGMFRVVPGSRPSAKGGKDEKRKRAREPRRGSCRFRATTSRPPTGSRSSQPESGAHRGRDPRTDEPEALAMGPLPEDPPR